MSIRAEPGPSSGRPASIADVARAAGVSVPTVSRVLTGAAKVSPQREQQVLAAIDTLGYRPSETARALATGRSRTIAVLTSDTTVYGYSTTIRGIEVAARDAGFGVAIILIDGPEAESAERAVDATLRQAVAGAIVLRFDPPGLRAIAALPARLPVVAASGVPDPSRSQALMAEEAAGAEITEHLLRLGHRTVHHVAVPPSRSEDSRTTGWRAALVRAGRPVPPVVTSTWDARDAVAVGGRLAADPEVTAVFCGNDEIAMGVIAGLTDAGMRVPEDVSVAGFDDHPLSSVWRPGITTMAQDFDDLGARAFALLQAELQGTTERLSSVAVPHLVERGSTGPAPGRPR